MKIVMYVDIYKGQSDYFCATSKPSTKIDGAKRYRFAIEIPDPLEVDADAVVDERTKEVDIQS